MASVSKSLRPPIDNDIKPIVRQHCGFGCVMCGIPFYHYDHVTGWVVTQAHEVAEGERSNYTS